ncbi:MAG: CotH kinase family protein [Bacteroidota bacterium]
MCPLPACSRLLGCAPTLMWALVLWTLGSTPSAEAQPRIFVNEFLASNTTVIADPDFGDFADWIELYNAEPDAVDLGGYTLTDDLDLPSRWRFPEGTVIPAGGFLLVWADDESTGLHTDFKLSAGGEQIGLYAPDGTVVDTLTYGEQTTDISLGRSPDGSPTFRFFETPTPGAPNVTDPSGGIAEAPTSSLAGGFYAGPQTVTLTAASGATIRYTRDGTPPTEDSPVYTAPLTFTETGVLRAVAFQPDRLPSPVVTRTLFIDEAVTVPVVSLVTDPANFFSDTSGIYVEGTNGIPGRCRNDPVNWNQDWERPVHVAFYEPDGTLGFEQGMGVQIFGGCSRIYPQKSLTLRARARYGASKVDYRVFPDLDIDEFDDLVLRSSAQDWWRTMFRDAAIQTMAEGDLDKQAYRPAIVFLNGDYWGIHNLREKLNEDYVAAHYDIDKDEVELLDGDPRGDSPHYDALLDYLVANDISQAQHFAYVQTQMDVDAYLDYLIAEIYSANADWPGNNLKLWRSDATDGRWRWMLFDLDFGFGGNADGEASDNTLALALDPAGPPWPNPPWSTFLFRQLMENDTFRHAFIQRLAARTATTYAPDRVLGVIDSLQAGIAAEIPRHKERWRRSISFGSSWDALVDVMRDFARNRPVQMRGHVTETLGVVGSAALELDAAEGGRVLAEGVPLPRGASRFPFYREVPLRLTAVPDEGYRFADWSGGVASSDETISVVLTGATALTATFAIGTDAEAEPVPAQAQLAQNYPNPFRTQTQIEVTHPMPGPLAVTVYDLLGREVLRLVDEHRAAGTHTFTLDATTLPSGVYTYAMSSGDTHAVRRMVVLR